MLISCRGDADKQNSKAKELIRLGKILYSKDTAAKQEVYVLPGIRKNVEKAFARYEEVVRDAPLSSHVPEALINMGRIRDAFGPAKAAIPYWLKIIYNYPDSEYYEEAEGNIKKVVNQWMAAANNHVYRGRYTEAIALYKQVLRINSYNAEAHLALGDAYSKANRYDEAIREYKTAIEIDPNYVEAQYLLGLVYLAKNQYETAISQFKNVIEIKPDMVVAYYNMALIYEENLNDKKKAREAWRKYIEKAKTIDKENKWLPTAEHHLKSL